MSKYIKYVKIKAKEMSDQIKQSANFSGDTHEKIF